jgi:DNA repair photolyase
MVREIVAKVLLSSAREADPWFGIKYTMNLYRGCQHGCIYCDTRSECYGIDDLSDIAVKTNAIELLRQELPRKRVKGTVGTGSMNDPYMPLDTDLRMTRQALEVIARYHYPVHIITKGDGVLRDIDLLHQIRPVYAAVSFTLTTVDDALASQVEPNSPPPSRRLAAMAALAKEGILTGVTMMPILPFLEDSEENIQSIVAQACNAGAQYIMPAFGMTLRDRQRDYYYAELDRRFPGIREKYEQRFGLRYSCAANQASRLERLFGELCARQSMPTHMPHYVPPPPAQPRLL